MKLTLTTLVLIISIAMFVSGCERQPVTPITPAVFRQQRALLFDRWKIGQITTSAKNRKLLELEDGVHLYCDDHCCGDGEGATDADWTD